MHGPEPRPAVELPIIRNNALVPRPGSSTTHLPCRRRSGSWPTRDLRYGVREDLLEDAGRYLMSSLTSRRRWALPHEFTYQLNCPRTIPHAETLLHTGDIR